MDDEIKEIIEYLKYPTGACGTHPNNHCFSNHYVHWVLDCPKFVLWVPHIVSPPSIPTWTCLSAIVADGVPGNAFRPATPLSCVCEWQG